MEQVLAILHGVRSPKTAAVGLATCILFLYFPYSQIGISEPKFVENYEAIILSIGIICLAVLLIEIVLALISLAQKPFVTRKRKKRVEEIFLSLNHHELCVALAMKLQGTRVIKGTVESHVLISMREKSALFLMSGFQSLHTASHQMPEDLFRYVNDNIEGRIDQDFLNSSRFEDDLREILDQALNWRNW